MASPIHGPRKRRTRQHVIADLSVHHVEGFILEEGHTAQRFGSDYGYDLVMWTFDRAGYPEPGSVYFQMKAAETLRRSGRDFAYDVDVRDFNLWMWERAPIILVLYDAKRGRAYWVNFQAYFRQDPQRRPTKGAKTVRVRVPPDQIISRRAIAAIRGLKPEMTLPFVESSL